MFPDEEGSETRVEWVPPAWPYLVRRCSSMRRGLKRQSGTTKIRPPRTSSTMFPDEEGTETTVRSDPATQCPGGAGGRRPEGGGPEPPVRAPPASGPRPVNAVPIGAHEPVDHVRPGFDNRGTPGTSS